MVTLFTVDRGFGKLYDKQSSENMGLELLLAIKETARQIDELDLETKLGGTDPFQAIIGAKWSIFLLVVASIIASLVIGNMLTPTYQASVTIILSKSAQNAFAQPAAINQIADGDQFLADVVSAIRSNYTQDELRDQISAVLVPGEPNSIAIQATDSSGKRAQILANASAEVFLARTKPFELAQVREEQMKLMVEAKKAGSANSLVSLADVDEELEGLKRDLPTIEQSALSESELATYSLALRGRINSLEQRKQSLLSEMLDEGRTLILAPAVRPRTPISPNIPRNVIFSAVAALIVGVTLAIAFRPSRFAKSS